MIHVVPNKTCGCNKEIDILKYEIKEKDYRISVLLNELESLSVENLKLKWLQEMPIPLMSFNEIWEKANK